MDILKSKTLDALNGDLYLFEFKKREEDVT